MAAKKKAATAKKQGSKKPVAKKAPVEIDAKIMAAAKKALPAIRSGEISLRTVWRDRLKLDSIATLRRALTELCGGNAQYLKMLEGRAKAREKKAA